MIVDHYNHHTFDNYYYFEDTFYFYNGLKYRVLHVYQNKSGNYYVHMTNTERKNICVYYTQFKQQYDLI